jgi:hypothetical protein
MLFTYTLMTSLLGKSVGTTNKRLMGSFYLTSLIISWHFGLVFSQVMIEPFRIDGLVTLQ